MASLIRDLAGSTAEMLAVFSDEKTIAAALRFEAALARALASEGLISAAQAGAINEACASLDVDPAQLAAEAVHAGTLAIPLVRRLRAAIDDPRTADVVHLGATSQDLADTVMMLQARAAGELAERDMSRIAEALARLAEAHAATPMLGRTLLQPAQPITFGLKASQWLLAIDDALGRLRREREAAMVLQFGGAAGTLAGLSGKGQAVAERLGAELGLAVASLPWHARRNAVAGLGGALAIVTAVVAKIAGDIALLAQAEVAEAFEPHVPGRGGSSIMAHKRNPTGCQVALSAALRTPGLAATLLSALPQEHERGLGGWQVEAPVLVDLFQLTHGAVAAMLAVIEGLEIDTAAMARNLAAAGVGADAGDAEAMVARALEQHRKGG
jgi:3-carboxy-cis,cis-muconate cycloisomerase